MERRLHKQKRAELVVNITTLCKKFKLHEVEEHVLPIFSKATWSQVLYLLKKNKKTITLEHVAQALMTLAKDVPYAFLEDMHFELIFTHKIVYHARYTWNAFKMSRSEGKVGLVTPSQMSEALKNSFGSLAHAPRIKVKLFGAFSWAMILLKKCKASGIEFHQEFYFAYSPGEPYLFASQKNIKKEISDGLLSALGYGKLKDCNLSASDITSMRTMLRNRAAKAFDAHSAQYSIAPYTPGVGVATEHGMDFTDDHLKINYSNMVFGENCPVIKRLTVKEKQPMLKKKQMYTTTLVIQSSDVYKFLKCLLLRGVIVLPLTPYIERLRTLGRNIIIIQPTDESSFEMEL